MFLIDKDLRTLQAADSNQAYEMLSQLRQREPDAGWQVVGPPVLPGTMTREKALDRLYALAGFLLVESGVNPFTIALQIGNLDGTTDEVTAVTVMRDAYDAINNQETLH